MLIPNKGATNKRSDDASASVAPKSRGRRGMSQGLLRRCLPVHRRDDLRDDLADARAAMDTDAEARDDQPFRWHDDDVLTERTAREVRIPGQLGQPPGRAPVRHAPLVDPVGPEAWSS